MIGMLSAAIFPAFFLIALFAPVQMSLFVGFVAIGTASLLPTAGFANLVPSRAMIPAGVFLLWCLISAMWSIRLDDSLEQLFQLLLVGACAFAVVRTIHLLPRFELRLVPPAAVVSLLLSAGFVVLVIVVELVAGQVFLQSARSILADYNRFAAILAVVVFPLLYLASQMRYPNARWLIVLIAVIAVLVILVNLQITTALVAFLVAAAVWGITLFYPSAGMITVLMIFFAAVVGPWIIVGLPLVPIEEISPSLLHRLMIWEFVQSQILESPILGWGLDASKNIPGGSELVSSEALGGGLAELRQWRWIEMAQAQNLPLHPHNFGLQILLELGLVGLFLMAWMVVSFLRWLRSLKLKNKAYACVLATISSGCVIGLASFGIWQTWWICSLFFAALFCVVAIRHDHKFEKSKLLIDDVEASASHQLGGAR